MILEVSFELMKVSSSIVLLFLSSFVLCFFCSIIINKHGAINDLIKEFFFFKFISQNIYIENILHFVKFLFVT